MSIWEFLYKVNENGQMQVNPVGWLWLSLVIIAIAFLLFSIVISFLVRKFVWPDIREGLNAVKDLTKQLKETNDRVRDLEEAKSIFEIADKNLYGDLVQQAELAKKMTDYSASIVRSMQSSCEDMKALSIASADKARMVQAELILVKEEMIGLRHAHENLLNEHKQRHAGEVISFRKPRQSKQPRK